MFDELSGDVAAVLAAGESDVLLGMPWAVDEGDAGADVVVARVEDMVVPGAAESADASMVVNEVKPRGAAHSEDGSLPGTYRR